MRAALLLTLVCVGACAVDPSSGGGAYPIVLFDHARISSDQSASNFQKVKATLPPLAKPATEVRLLVDLATTCFPFDGWAANPPPSGQNWPADCDAFDRNFEILLGGPVEDGPRVELVRAITPFGGPMHLDVDVTDIVNFITTPKTFEIDITTYADAAGKVTGSNGGWTVTAQLNVIPGVAPRHLVALLPIVDTSATTTSGAASFSLPGTTKSGRIEYRATGHGGAPADPACIGPADEFCMRHHSLSLDGTAELPFDPWRQDCDTLCTTAHYVGMIGEFDYCAENPCGNMNSVKASRANWCPGSVTEPLVWEPPGLNAGSTHTFGWSIDKVSGNWRLTATVFAYGD